MKIKRKAIENLIAELAHQIGDTRRCPKCDRFIHLHDDATADSARRWIGLLNKHLNDNPPKQRVTQKVVKP